MSPSIRKSLPFAALTVALLASTTFGALAQRMDPDLIPPEVTLTPGGGSNTPSAATTAAPGTAGAAQAAPTQPGQGQPAAGQPGNLPYGGAPSGAAQQAGTGKYNPFAQNNMPSRIPEHGEAIFHAPPTDPNKKDPIATIETNKGTIKILLFRKVVPNTAGNFIDLAGRGFYNGLTFHRYEPGFCIQGGDPLGTGLGDYINPETKQPRFLSLEVSPQLTHNAPGVVAMARSASPDSASCQFYITLGKKSELDGKYAVFGGVIDGMNVVNELRKGDVMRTVVVEEQP